MPDVDVSEQEPTPAPEAPGAAVEDPAVRTCETCGAAMARDQDWCLACGSAAAGRLGTRPGWRAAVTVAGLTVALVCGAVAASYAALSSDATKSATATAPASGTPVPGQQAQIPAPGAPAPGAPATPPAAGATPPVLPPTTGTTATTPTIPALPKLPTTKAPSSSSSSTTTTSPTTSSSTTTTPTTTTTTSTDTTTTTTTPANTGDGTSQTRPELTPITLAPGALAPYDPYGRATDKGDPATAQDDRDDTAWFVTAPSDGKPMQLGLAVDLGKVQLVRALTIKTSTPGFRLEVYGSNASTMPPDVLDTRWAHVVSRSDVDQNSNGTNEPGDGEERVVFPKDGDRYRHVLLWFTTPPHNTTTVKLGEVSLLG